MLLKGSSIPAVLQRRVVSIPLALVLTLVVYSCRDLQTAPCCSGLFPWPSIPNVSSGTAIDDLTLPELAELAEPADHSEYSNENAEFCDKRFTATYLEHLRDHAMQYCEPVDGTMPQSRLTCFHAHVRDDKKTDSFCFGSGATWDGDSRKFRLDCPVVHRPDINETAAGMVPLESITASWFDTGPKQVFGKFVTLTKVETASQEKSSFRPDIPTATESFVILVKREGNNNLWHNLMEIWSMMNSVDTLRISPQTGEGHVGQPSFQTPENIQNTHVIMLDGYEHESAYDLWRFFAPHNPIVKLQDMIEDPARVPLPLQQPGGEVNIIVPMSGASNPLWQNDWVVRDCQHVPLLKLFVRRVFGHLAVPFAVGPRPTADLTIMFIDRRGTRQLLNKEPLFDKLQEKHPNAIIQQVDFATLSLQDQLRLVQDTDVLVGVHGAGLTHTMFMREGAGAVVEIQPENMGHKGFRNLAVMMGHQYFSSQAKMVVPGDDEAEKSDSKSPAVRHKEPDKPWQSSHVRLEETAF